jgi:hypothetical protein
MQVKELQFKASGGGSSHSGSGSQENCGSRPALKKVSKNPISSNKKLGVVACACHHSCTGNVTRRLSI